MTKAKKPLHIKNHYGFNWHKLPKEQQIERFNSMLGEQLTRWQEFAEHSTHGPCSTGNLLFGIEHSNVLYLLLCYCSEFNSEPWMLEHAVYRLRRMAVLTGSVLEGATASEPRSYRIDGFNFTTSPIAPTDAFIGYHDWKEWVGVALLCRDPQRLAQVVSYWPQWAKPNDYLKVESQLLVEYLCLGARQDPRLREFHERHFSRIFAAYEEIAVLLLIFMTILDGDAEAFEQAVIHATQVRYQWVKSMRDHWDKYYYFPTLLMGAVALGFDTHGWCLQHRNDYIPRWLVENELDSFVAQANQGVDLRAQVLPFLKIKYKSQP